MKYYQATVSTVSDFTDTLSVLMIEWGSEGVTVVDGEEIRRVLAAHNWDYADPALLTQAGDAAYVSGYYPEGYDFEALAANLERTRAQAGCNVGTLELSLKQIDSADYENEWKKYYTPIELQKICVVPEWMTYDGDRLPVRIDPGMAFGTGSHETTAVCLQLIETLPLRGACVADIGCGSGILGAAALRLGAKSCLMADIDPQATEAALKNCTLNGVADRAEIVCGTMPCDRHGAFSYIFANITADILISLVDAFYDALTLGGEIVLSGVILARDKDVTAAYERAFTCMERVRDGEWLGYLWRKKEVRA